MPSIRMFHLSKGSVISSTTTDFEVQNFLGSGSFGAVFQCRKSATDETVAIKIIMDRTRIVQAQEEAKTLDILKSFNSGKFNIVTLIDSFTFEGRYCLVFEKLDISLRDFLQKRPNCPLLLKEIRPILHQVATALDFLKCFGFSHTDLKPENIMMVDHVRQPLRVKIIDFGEAIKNPAVWVGAYLQSRYYRSPEILLGAGFSEAIDVWSLGCIAAELYLGRVLFPGTNVYDMMRRIVLTVGPLPQYLLNAGRYTQCFFHPNFRDFLGTMWQLRSAYENGPHPCDPRIRGNLRDFLMTLLNLSGEDLLAKIGDWITFVDLVTLMLNVDPLQRVTPGHILQHPFITMSHLVGAFSNNTYVKSCAELMSICRPLTSDNGKPEVQVTGATCPTGETSNVTASVVNPSVPNHPGGSCEEQPLHNSTDTSCPEKKQRMTVDDTEGRPDTILAKKRRSKGPGTASKKRDRKANRDSVVRKSKRKDTGLCVNAGKSHTSKKSRINLDKEQTSQLQQKRKRRDYGSNNNCIKMTLRSVNLNKKLAK